jgi:two-component system sensor histidine kinase/response regulator
MTVNPRRNLLVPALGVAALACLTDWHWAVETITAALYVGSILVSLWSNRAWHTLASGAFSICLLLTTALLTPRGLHGALDHTTVAVVIGVIGTLALRNLSRTRAESIKWARTQQAHQESDQLHAALERAEAAESKHREALNRLTIATQGAGISMWEWDLSTNLLHAELDGVLSQRVGGRESIPIHEYLAQYVHPDEISGLKAALRPGTIGIVGEDDLISHRYRCFRSDGATRVIQIHARVARDSNGRPSRYLGVEWDVTAEVESAQRLENQTRQLEDAKRRLERASLSSNEGHWEVDLLKDNMWVSSSLEALLGYSPGWFKNDAAQLLALVHSDEREAHERLFRQHLENSDIAFDSTVRHKVADGSYRWFKVHGAAERDANGAAFRIAGSLTDVHEQKTAEDELRDVRARFERAIGGTQDGLWEADRKAQRMWLSPRAHALLGFAKGELHEGISVLRERVHPEDVPISDTAVFACVESVKPIDVELRMARKDGVYRWYRLRGTPATLDADGKLVRSAGSLQDVTEARDAREALIHATEAAKAASHAKTTFLATMSHEIRTPMNGIIGMTGLLLDSELDRTQREYADAIRSSSQSLLAVINDILDFSKIEAGKLDVENIEFDLRGNVEDVSTMMALLAASKNLELIVDIHADVPSLVLGDPQRMRQCLINLASNAIKFTSSGEIVIEVSLRDAQVCFSVRDTGIGIAAETLEKLFDPFTQADSSTTRKFGGTGLGLSIVKRLVELMGGEIGVQSRFGKGSNFYFKLPLKPVAPAQIITKAKGQRILVVDDNDTSRRVLSKQLEHAGYRVDVVGSSTEALQRATMAVIDNKPYDVLLVDSTAGAALGEAINGDPQLSRSRLILLTSLNSEGDHERFAAMGFAAYLTKPVRASELRDCLERVLSRDSHEWHIGTHPLITRGVLASAAPEASSRGRVLVVEDNIVNQKVAQKCLERLGFSVRVAEDGSKAVTAFGEERFDIIFMDMQMPVMDGVTATREIRSREAIAGTRTPIVALTANVLSDHFQSCLEAGMDDVLAKPIDMARLRDLLDRFAPGGQAEIPADLPRRAS